MEDFRSLLVPKEGSRRLYLNRYYDLDLGVAMCFEKRVDVGRDRRLVGKRVDVGSDRMFAFIFSGSAAVAAGQSVRRPQVRQGGRYGAHRSRDLSQGDASKGS